MEMIKDDLVSIITPAYNTSKYIHRLLDSVIAQSYPYIEMIVVDDGSNDNLSEIIKPYYHRFSNRGYNLIYLYQTNSGQSEAIQNALNHITGAYIAWPDSDDWYDSPETIERFVDVLKNAPKGYAMVRCQGNLIDEESGKTIKLFGENCNEYESESLFEDCLLDKNGFYFPPGAYMIKTQALKESSRLPIFTSHDAGQNWQLMLPVLYHYSCRTILKPMFNVLSRSDSHSRTQLEYHHFRERRLIFEKTIIETLNRIVDISDKDLLYYSKKAQEKYALMLWDMAIRFKETKDEKKEYQRLKKLNQLTFRQRVVHTAFRYRLMPLYRTYQQIKAFVYAHNDKR